MVNVCITCLSNDRQLYKIQEHALHLYKYLVREELYPVLMGCHNICWECSAQIRNMLQFQEKATTSLRILQTYLDKFAGLPEDNSIKSLSKLRTTKVQIISSPDTVIKNVKTENTEVSHQDGVDMIPDDYDRLADDEAADHFYIPILKEESTGFNNSGVKVETQPIDIFSNCMQEPETCTDDEEIQTQNRNQNITDGTNNELVTIEEPQRETITVQMIKVRNDLLKKHTELTATSFKCHSCLLDFDSEDNLSLHNKEYHDESAGPYKCEACLCRFKTDELHKQHVAAHHVYKCMKCDFNTLVKITLKQHINKTHGSIKCPQCDLTFRTYGSRTTHLMKVHNVNVTCNKCEQVFSKRTEYMKHLQTHNDLARNLSVKCPICKKSYNKYYINAHISMVHKKESPEETYCALCDHTFKSIYSYKAHFTQSLKHVTHEQFRYECSACQKRFSTKALLKHHVDVVHVPHKFSCDKCEKTFSLRQRLRHHMNKHDPTYVPQRRAICDTCGNGFLSKKSLRMHLVTHTGERPYKCELCAATFGFSASLYTHHKLVHLGIKRKTSKKKNVDV